MNAVVMPDQRTFVAHVARGRFQAGVDRGDWSLETLEWPHPVLFVSAAERDGAPGLYAFRFDLDRYPNQAPTAEPWDVEADIQLAHDRWPNGSGQFATVFNPDWMPQPGVHALYHPMDRRALAGHDDWRGESPERIWDPTRMDIVDYLVVVYELLHSHLYSGIRRAG